MKTKFWLLALVLAMLVPEAAWGQSMQVVTTRTSKGPVTTMFAARETSGYSVELDYSDFTDLYVSVNLTPTNVNAGDDCQAINFQFYFMGGNAKGITQQPFNTINSNKVITVDGYTDYVIGPLPKYGRFYMSVIANPNHCAATVTVVPWASATVNYCAGPAIVGSTYTGPPVIVGGTSGGAVHTLSVDATGRVPVIGPGVSGYSANGAFPLPVAGSNGTNLYTLHTDANGNLYTNATITGSTDASLTAGLTEVLVDVTATQISTSTTYGSLFIQNTGPKPIYCGTSNAVTLATGVKVDTAQAVAIDMLSPSVVYCITTVLQVTGAATRYGVSMTYDRMRFYGGGGGGGASGVMGVSVPANVSLSANVSGAITGLTAEQLYRISCDAAASFRTGSGTPTAVTTDSALFANTVMDVKMKVGDVAIAFLSGSATTCRAALLVP